MLEPATEGAPPEGADHAREAAPASAQGLGRIVALIPTVSGLHMQIRIPAHLLHELQIGASVSVDGVCLSVVAQEGTRISFEAIAETQALTRRYARRQVSWFKRYADVTWLSAGATELPEIGH